MMLKTITTSLLRIPFRAAFRHASAERAVTETLWVEACSKDGFVGYGEGCPREYVTGENLNSAENFVAMHVSGLQRTVYDVA